MNDINPGNAAQNIQTDGGAAVGGNVTIDRGSTFVGRDQIINTIQQIARTAAEEAEQTDNLEREYLAAGGERLRDRAATPARTAP